MRKHAADTRWPVAQCVSPHVLVIEPATQRLFTSCKDGKLFALRARNGRIVATVQIGRRASMAGSRVERSYQTMTRRSPACQKRASWLGTPNRHFRARSLWNCGMQMLSIQLAQPLRQITQSVAQFVEAPFTQMRRPLRLDCGDATSKLTHNLPALVSEA